MSIISAVLHVQLNTFSVCVSLSFGMFAFYTVEHIILGLYDTDFDGTTMLENIGSYQWTPWIFSSTAVATLNPSRLKQFDIYL